MSQAGNNNQCIVASSLALYTFNVAAGDEATIVKLILRAEDKAYIMLAQLHTVLFKVQWLTTTTTLVCCIKLCTLSQLPSKMLASLFKTS